jgi:hypothetical protein
MDFVVEADLMETGDIVAVFLGCPHPIVIREASSVNEKTYKVIGPAYVNGLMESQAILGHLPSPWVIRVDWSTGKEKWIWYNTETQELSPDLRLGDLPAGWSQSEEGTLRDPNGEVQVQDPRESVEALKARGAKIEIFRLV